jgi:plastocyanin
VTARTAVAGCAAATAVAIGGACARRPPPPRSHAVAIRNFEYEPDTLTVAPGDTVVWTNADFVPHTATTRDTLWDSGTIAANGAWRFVARRPGRHPYYCVFHPNMQGTIEVR